MKKILIISYYFKPLNAVSSYRVSAFAKYLNANEFEVTVVTRHWGESYQSWENAFSVIDKPIELEVYDNYKIYRLPYLKKVKIYNCRIYSKIYWFLNIAFGNIQTEIDTFEAFYPFLDNHLSKNEYDAILVSAPPFNIVKLGAKLSNKYNIPLIVDIRDFISIEYFRIKRKFSIRNKILKAITLYYLKKWVKHADMIISIGETYSKIISNVIKREVLTVTNGFEKEVFNAVPYTNNKQFTIRYIGSAFHIQDFEPITVALNKFLKTHPITIVETIGLMNSKHENIFKKNIPKENLIIIKNRLSKEKVVDKTKNSDIIIFPAYKGYTGIYGTKIFDYIASGSFVLVYPGDNNVIDDLLKKTKTGIIAKTEDEVIQILEAQYIAWLNNEQIKSSINPIIDDFSREKIVSSFSKILTSRLLKNKRQDN